MRANHPAAPAGSGRKAAWHGLCCAELLLEGSCAWQACYACGCCRGWRQLCMAGVLRVRLLSQLLRRASQRGGVCMGTHGASTACRRLRRMLLSDPSFKSLYALPCPALPAFPARLPCSPAPALVPAARAAQPPLRRSPGSRAAGLPGPCAQPWSNMGGEGQAAAVGGCRRGRPAPSGWLSCSCCSALRLTFYAQPGEGMRGWEGQSSKHPNARAKAHTSACAGCLRDALACTVTLSAPHTQVV